MRAQRGFPAIIKPSSVIAVSSASPSRSRSIPIAAHCCTIRQRTRASRSSCAKRSTTPAGKSRSCSPRRSTAARSTKNCPHTTKNGCSLSCSIMGTCRRICVYEGSTRSGYKTLPGPADEARIRRDPVPLGVLLDADMWTAMLFEERYLHAAGRDVSTRRRHGPHRAGVCAEARPHRPPLAARSPPSAAPTTA